MEFGGTGSPGLEAAGLDQPARMRLFEDPLRGEERRALYREIWRLAWPAFVGQGLNSVVGGISRVIVGQLGEKSYNSVNVGMMVFFMIITVIAAVGVGTTALVAQAWGGGDRKQAGRILQQSLLFGLLLSLAIAVLGMPTSRLVYSLMGSDEETVRQGSQFLIWLFAAIPLLAPGFFLAAGLRGAGDTRTPMIIGLFMGGISLVLSYGLVLGKLGMPRYETLGAAWAIDGAFLCFTLLMGALFIANKTILHLPLRGWRLDWKIGLAIFKIGIPSALEWVLIQLGLLVYVFVISKYGEEAVAGYFTGLVILTVLQTPAFGFQAAAVTLVGQNVGARKFEQAESAFRHCAFLSFLFMAAVGILMYIGSDPRLLGRAFGKLTPQTLAYTRDYCLLTAFAMPLMGIAFTVAGGLRGAGDTVPPLIASSIGVYGGRIAAAFMIYYLVHPPVLIIWCSMFPDMIIRIVLMAVRMRSGKWKRAKI
jgi:putative MATE family efflux protein